MKKLAFLIPFLSIIISCDDNLEVVTDPEVQREADLKTIQDYIAAKGYTDIDTTNSGTRYTILTIGDGESIDLNDHVSFNYAMATSDDSVHVTNIKLTAIENSIYDSLRTYEPRIFTYSGFTWSIPSILRDAFSSVEYPESGFKEGLLAVTEKMNVGGHAVLMIPSGAMYGTRALGTIPANSVVIIDIFLVKVRPQ